MAEHTISEFDIAFFIQFCLSEEYYDYLDWEKTERPLKREGEGPKQGPSKKSRVLVDPLTFDYDAYDLQRYQQAYGRKGGQRVYALSRIPPRKQKQL